MGNRSLLCFASVLIVIALRMGMTSQDTTTTGGSSNGDSQNTDRLSPITGDSVRAMGDTMRRSSDQEPEEEAPTKEIVRRQGDSSGRSNTAAVWLRGEDRPSKYLAHDLPVRQYHRDHPFLVVAGVLVMDTADGEERRKVTRQTWMQYRGVFHEARRPDGSMLVKFVMGRHSDRKYQFGPRVSAEVVEHHGDLLGVEMKERRSKHKQNSSTYGTYGLEHHVKGICLKSLLWRIVALALYHTEYVAKLDDDIFLVVPRYLLTLRSLPRNRTMWGFGAQCRWNSFNSSTRFPYVYGMAATASLDLTHIVASSTHLQPVLDPFTGRASDYLYDRLDREDIMIASAIAKHAQRNPEDTIQVYHDCRFIEPSFINIRQFFANRNDYRPFRFQFAVMMHKMPLSQYSSAMLQYSEEAVKKGPRATFREAPYDIRPYRWMELRQHYCSSKLVDNCDGVYTPWPELGPFQRPTLAKKSSSADALLIAVPLQNLTMSSTPLLVVIGLWTKDTVLHAHARRAFRDAAWMSIRFWSPSNTTRQALLRFVVEGGKTQRSLSPTLLAEANVDADIVALKSSTTSAVNMKKISAAELWDQRMRLWSQVSILLYSSQWYALGILSTCNGNVASLQPAAWLHSVVRQTGELQHILSSTKKQKKLLHSNVTGLQPDVDSTTVLLLQAPRQQQQTLKDTLRLQFAIPERFCR